MRQAFKPELHACHVYPPRPADAWAVVVALDLWRSTDYRLHYAGARGA